MNTPTLKENEEQFTLSEDEISVGSVSSEKNDFKSAQVSKVTSEESGQNQQNFQNN